MGGIRLAAVVLGLVLTGTPAAAAPANSRPPYTACPLTAPAAPPHAVPATSRAVPEPVVGGDGLATAGLTVPDGVAPPSAAALSARSWLVADLDTGEVLGGCGPHETGAPASLQKLLLAATVLPRLDPAAQVQIVPADLDFEPGSSSVGLLLGGHYPVETLWLGLLLNSGNDAANVLARLGGGDGGVPATLDAMNAEARRLGAYDTHAATPSGLDGPGQATSAYDLALIARACLLREDFRRYAGTRQAHMPAQPPLDLTGYDIQNDNQLLFDYPGAIGGKTGFTDLARHTYVGAAERNGRRLVVALMGAENTPARGWQQGATLLDWGFALPRGASVGRLVEPGAARRNRALPPDDVVDAQAERAPTGRAENTAAQRPGEATAVQAGPASAAVPVIGLPSTPLLMVGALAGALGAPAVVFLAARGRRGAGRRGVGRPRRIRRGGA